MNVLYGIETINSDMFLGGLIYVFTNYWVNRSKFRHIIYIYIHHTYHFDTKKNADYNY